MENLKILNSREKKNVLKLVKEQWDADFDTDLVVLLSNRNKVYLVNADFSKVDEKHMRIEKVGLYFGEIVDKEIRLSIEGCQLIGPIAKKNIIELSDGEVKVMFHGNDLIKKDIGDGKRGFVILKNNSDFIGCGKVRGEEIINYIPKTRRILSED
ncbi:MAG: hypothetical protein NT001_02760 [Candidatus Woesearchaeota archaeon]|nr:hypothetical protein [Candidatus Woesearchaeota archaeon]